MGFTENLSLCFANTRLRWLGRCLCVLVCAVLWSGTAFAASSIPFPVSLSEPVVVTGTPRIALDVGGTTRYATYASGSGTSTLTFTYATQAGDLDLDGITVSSPIDLNGGTIKDLAGNDLTVLSFTPPNTTGIKVNHPSVSMDFVGNDYILNGTHYASLGGFLTAAGGSFTRGSVGTYFDSSGVMQTAAANTPRFDFDPVTHVAKGILLEEGRTNSVRNGNASGAVTGTPGTIPTKWSLGGVGLGTLVQQIVGTGTENGIPYVDYRVSGTTSTTSFVIYFDHPYDLAIPAASGQTWTASVYTKIVAGNLANLSLYIGCRERASTGSDLADSKAALTPTATLARYTVTRTFNNVSTVYATGDIEFNFSSGVPIDITLRIGGAQLERGAFPTSYIPTTSAAVARGGETLSLPASGGWYDNANGTLYVAALPFVSTAAIQRTIASVSNASISNRYEMAVTTGGLSRFEVVSGGVKSADISLAPSVSTVATSKFALSFMLNNFSYSMNGSTPVNDNAGILPVSPDTFYIGRRGTTDTLFTGTISMVKYYPAHVTDAQLTLLTQ